VTSGQEPAGEGAPQRVFLARAVHFPVTHAGIRQFLDIGTVHRWRPGAEDPTSERDLAIYAGVGRKP
jgi:hypothetical protein